MQRHSFSKAVVGAVTAAALLAPAAGALAQQAFDVSANDIARFFQNPGALHRQFYDLLISHYRQFRSEDISVQGVDIPDGLVTYLVHENMNRNDPAFIRDMYTTLLSRQPSNAEVNGWLSTLHSGQERRQIVLGFLQSQEFRNSIDDVDPGTSQREALISNLLAATNHLSNSQFVRTLYASLLNRQPSQQEVNAWLQSMQNGMSRRQVIIGFLDSPEYRNLQ